MISTETYHIDWHKLIPEHWQVFRIKNLFDEIDERSVDGSEELLSVSHYTGVTKKRDALESEDDFISNAKTLVGYKKVAKNDLVSNIMLAWNGSLGISKYEGITSPAYCVYRIKGNNNPDYFGYLFSTALMKGDFRKKSFGIIDSRLRLYSDKFFSLFSAVPPRDEQDAIVEHIRNQSEKITHFIQKKKAFIELLKEQRQGVINNAVTKGIDHNVKLKDSGIEWLGEIPDHWEVKRLKNVTKIISKGTTPSTVGSDTVKDGTIRFIKAENLNGKDVSETPIFFIDEETDSLLFRSRLQENDILLVIAGATIGRLGLLTKSFIPANTNQAVCFIRPKGIEPEYLLFWLKCDYINEIMWFHANQAAQPNLAMGNISQFRVIVPPSKTEQNRIVQYIKTETTKIDQAIAKAEQEISLIKEYKEAMIAEAVLGKLNVSQQSKLEMENAK
jgi:type I restriction enzyme S subunit